jgi:hypothetical protein
MAMWRIILPLPASTCVRIGELGAAIEAEIHVGAVGDDVAKAVLQWFAG